jgi:hypothetical protein
MRRRIHVSTAVPPYSSTYKEEDTCVSYEEEHTCEHSSAAVLIYL